MARLRVGLGAWVAAVCAAGAGCSGSNAVLIGQIPEGGSGADGSLVGSDDASQGSSGAADATTGSTSGGSSSGASGSSSGSSGGDDGGSIDAGGSGSSSGTASSSSSGAASGSSGAAEGGSSGSSSGASGSSGGSSSSGASSSGGSSSGAADGSTGNGCDSGGLLAFKSVWTLPTVTPSSIAVDAQGDVYVAGIFNGSVTFGTTTLTGPTGVATGDIFLVKYSSTGSVVFAKAYGTATGIYGSTMLAVDAAGNVFMGGSFSGTLTMGGGTAPLVAIAIDAFAAKVSPAGVTLWADHFGYNGGPYAVLSVAVGPDGNPVVAGTSTGTIVLGSTTWTAPASTSQPFLAKLSTSNGAVVWSNAAGGNIKSGEDIWIGVDTTNRVFMAARVESGGGSWGVEPEAGASTFDTMRAGFDANGNVMWGQFDYGAFPVAAAVDTAGRFNVVENGSGAITIGGTTKFNAGGGYDSLSVLFSPTDGTLLSGVNIDDTFTSPNGGAIDAHGNAFVTGTYWPQASPVSVGGLSFPATGNGGDHPVFLAATDGLSHGVGATILGGSNNAQPLAVAADSVTGNVYVAITNPASFASSIGTLQAGTYLAVFDPDPCDDGSGPLGTSTGTPGNHGDLGPDGGSPYVAPDAGSPAACPANASGAVNGAACPVARGCSYTPSECCFCTPTVCGAAASTWTCNSVANGSGCPGSAPSPGASCGSTSLQCNYCTAQGRMFAQCTAGGWETGLAQVVCH